MIDVHKSFYTNKTYPFWRQSLFVGQCKSISVLVGNHIGCESPETERELNEAKIGVSKMQKMHTHTYIDLTIDTQYHALGKKHVFQRHAPSQRKSGFEPPWA